MATSDDQARAEQIRANVAQGNPLLSDILWLLDRLQEAQAELAAYVRQYEQQISEANGLLAHERRLRAEAEDRAAKVPPTIVPGLVERIQRAVKQIEHALSDSRIDGAAAAWLRTIKDGLNNQSGEMDTIRALAADAEAPLTAPTLADIMRTHDTTGGRL